MHIWVIEGKKNKCLEYQPLDTEFTRIEARKAAVWYQDKYDYKTRVVKYISTKGE